MNSLLYKVSKSLLIVCLLILGILGFKYLIKLLNLLLLTILKGKLLFIINLKSKSLYSGLLKSILSWGLFLLKLLENELLIEEKLLLIVKLEVSSSKFKLLLTISLYLCL